MNKQMLAQTIWNSANELRGKVEAVEYKNYVLGLLFYKFLSDKELDGLHNEGWTDEYIERDFLESDEELRKAYQGRFGYFIEYKNLYSTWIDKGDKFDISDVNTGLSAFNRLIAEEYKRLFEDIFTSLQIGLMKLGSTSGEQTKNVRRLIEILDEVPTSGKNGYDVLGFIYEYLLNQFASNSGKKAGEFYTPNEVSEMMSAIVADHLKGRETISIYDPTSGSGSLLMHIGRLASEHLDKDHIKFYAQDFKEDAYNLTRMNLVMKGIHPSNIQVRNADTLGSDWPVDDNSNDPLYVDAVVSNPPYSHHWTPEVDSRFSEYGLPPKNKADYAFLLHDLYHLKPDGIMAIVLPHGVLFRGDSEYQIRRKLIEMNQIEAIIGLPPNMFYNTSISTIVMILRKCRDGSDVLFVDASKDYSKVGKKNALRYSDIKRITDTVIGRKEIQRYSYLASKEEIVNRDYDLNISGFIDSSEEAETWDFDASVRGGIPDNEIETLSDYWTMFPTLRGSIFKEVRDGYSVTTSDDLYNVIHENKDVSAFIQYIDSMSEQYGAHLKDVLIEHWDSTDAIHTIKGLVEQLWNLFGDSGIDPYHAYQVLLENWNNISDDLATLRLDGLAKMNVAVPNMISKKDSKTGKMREVQDGWRNIIIPQDMIINHLLPEIGQKKRELEDEIRSMEYELDDLLDSIDDEWRESNPELFNDELDDFDKAAVKKISKSILKDMDYEPDSPEEHIVCAGEILRNIGDVKKKLKHIENDIVLATKDAIENASYEDLSNVMYIKWVLPIVDGIKAIPRQDVDDLISSVKHLSEKYAYPISDISNSIRDAEEELLALLDQISDDSSDPETIRLLKRVFGGE